MRRMILLAAAMVLLLYALGGLRDRTVGAQTDNGPGEAHTVFLPVTIRGISGGGSAGIWLSPQEIAALPTQGKAWENVLERAQEDASRPRLADQNDQTDATVMAKALVYVRTGEPRYRHEVIEAIVAAMGTESGANTLAIGRNLVAYVIAADLVGLDGATDAAFRAWLGQMQRRVFDGSGPNLSLVSCHGERPNNFGTHCGASRLAVALYLGDQSQVQRAAAVFRGWLGDRDAYTGFNFGPDLSWQCDPVRPVPVNPAGCQKNGHSLDGVLPDDQRRAGAFTWPPPAENYVWEALQGAVAQAWMLQRAGYPAFEWQDRALLRATRWLYEEVDYPASGDDSGTPWLINHAYGSDFATRSPARPGKNGLGFYDWYTAR